MLTKILLYGLFGPIIAVAYIAQFFVWEIISTGQWKTYNRMRQSHSQYVLQEQVESLTFQIKEERHANQSKIDDLQRKHDKELQALKKKYER